MLKFVDSNKQDNFGSIVNYVHQESLRTSCDGKLGGTYDVLSYVKNDDGTLYYVDITINPVSETYDDVSSEWGETGFGLKLLYGERRPTELEWDQVKSGEAIALPDIGTTASADTANYFPFWLRAIVPGLTPAQIKDTISITVSYHAKQVGS